MTVAFYLPGGVPVLAFALLQGLGVSLGLGWTLWQAPAERAAGRLFIGTGVLITALIGARASYLAVHWEYFQTRPLELIELPIGGLTWAGAIAGALLGLLLTRPLQREPVAELAGGLLPVLTAVGVAVWLACWLDGCAYGQPSEAWFRVPARDEWGNLTDRFPLQFVGALLMLFTSFLIERFNFKRPGQAVSLGLGLLGLQMLPLTSARADLAPIVAGLRLNSWAALALILAGAILFLLSLRRRPDPLQLSDHPIGHPNPPTP